VNVLGISSVLNFLLFWDKCSFLSTAHKSVCTQPR